MNSVKEKEYRKKALPLYISILDRLKKEAEEELQEYQEEDGE